MYALKRDKSKKIALWSLLCFVILAIILSKDHLHASLNKHSFYAGESLLFGSYYLFFFAFWFLYKRLYNKTEKSAVLFLPIIFTAAHLIVFAAFVYTCSKVFFVHSFGLEKTLSYAFFEHGLLSLFVYSLFLFIPLNPPTKTAPENSPIEEKKISVMYKDGIRLLKIKEVLYVKAERPYIAVFTQERKYLMKLSLKIFLEENADHGFIQIHKSLLINSSYLTGFRSRKNGDYDLVLAEKHFLRASRSFRANFLPIINSLA